MWPGERKGSIDEIEDFYGLHVHDLESAGGFTSVPVFWPA